MSIEQRIKYHKYLLVSKCLKNEAPIYLKNKIHYLSDRNLYSLRNVVSEKLQIPNDFPKQHSNNQLKAKCNLNKKVALIQGLNIS
jgi:ribosomal protein S13